MNSRCNIVNFIRGLEPRSGCNQELHLPVTEQLKLIQQHDLPATWLFQYDAFIRPDFVSLLNGADSSQEIGVWLEIVQPMVEKAGMKWRGRYPWDWFSDVGFAVGYTPDERRKLIDVCFAEFEKVFGHKPRSVGSWILDAPSMEYMSDKYNIDAFCICKEQSGTDGYTLWGGYYNNAFYPSRKHGLLPARNPENQINTPVFRMLGADPIYQYNADTYIYEGKVAQRVYTLEPVSKQCGSNSEWIRWYFDLNESAGASPFGYLQVGQENSFGWPGVKDGYTEQIKLVVQRRNSGKLTVETLAETGKWFKDNFEQTPATVIEALDDWKQQGNRTVWFHNRYYRINIHCTSDSVFIRDLMLYNDDYRERYLNDVCKGPHAAYSALKITGGLAEPEDPYGNQIRPVLNNDPSRKFFSDTLPQITGDEGESKVLSWETVSGDIFSITLSQKTIEISCGDQGWSLMYFTARQDSDLIQRVSGSTIEFMQEGFEYSIEVLKGSLVMSGSDIVINPDGGSVVIKLAD